MKKTLLTILLLSLVSGVCLPQAVVRREKKKDKTEQTSQKKQQREAEKRRRYQEEQRRQREEEERRRQEEQRRQREEEERRRQEQGAKPDGYINGHGYVDLGLPSGTKWATCNVGASRPEDYGDHFAWGETSPKAEYIDETSSTALKRIPKLKSQGIIDSNNNLTPSYDAACVNWGGTWRMPTKAEMEELKEKCDWKWTYKVKGEYGYKVTGPNGKTIYLPAAGWREKTSLYSTDWHGGYWSSTTNDGDYSAYFLFFNNSSGCGIKTVFRRDGRSIRPVSD